ncbi:unnamed protein product [Symbiodinium sp. CCMP2592]|nr:unnamed protein product [Symbiodinium sp. CCMP2592]
MPPKGPSKPSKQPAKGNERGQDPPTSKLEFGYPVALNTALQEISARAAQDIWRGPVLGDGEASAEQLAQGHANAVTKLGKRMEGDVRAKIALREALSTWTMSLSSHLDQLVQRVRAIGAKLAEDAILQLAGGLRAFGNAPAAPAMPAPAPLLTTSFTLAEPLLGSGDLLPIQESTARRPYGRPLATRSYRPYSRWCTDEELIPAAAEPTSSDLWTQAWLHLVKFSVEQGEDLIGELAVNPEQEALRPPVPDRPTSLSIAREGTDLFTVSLPLCQSSEVAFHQQSGATAVVIHPAGLVYTQAPAFADQMAIRSSVMGDFLQEGRDQGLDFSHFARVLPPLEQLPAVQFVALDCPAGQIPGLLDLRPLGGSLHVLPIEAGTSPLRRLQFAVEVYGEPLAGLTIASAGAQGRLTILHREEQVNPALPLYGAVPVPLVVLLRPDHPVVGSVPTASSEELSESGASSVSMPTRLGVLLSVLWLRPAWWILLVLPQAFAVLDFLGPEPLPSLASISVTRAVDPQFRDLPPIATASPFAHARLARRIQSGSDWVCADWECPLDRSAAPSALFLAKVFTPGGAFHFSVSGDQSSKELQNALFRSAIPDARTFPVLVQPQFFDHSIQFVAPAREPHLVTVLVDSGTSWDCLDVPRHNAGEAILHALQLLHPGSTFRLDLGPAHPLRHGDVISAKLDQRHRPVEIGQFSLSPAALPGQTWLEELVTVAVLGMPFGLCHFQVPRNFAHTPLEEAVGAWHNFDSGDIVELLRLPLRQYALDLFCLLPSGSAVLAVVLTDLSSCSDRPIVGVVEGTDGTLPELLRLARQGTPHDGFWADVLSRGRAIMHQVHTPAHHTRSGTVCRFVHLGLDFCRAIDHGWSVSQVEEARVRSDLPHTMQPSSVHVGSACWALGVCGMRHALLGFNGPMSCVLVAYPLGTFRVLRFMATTKLGSGRLTLPRWPDSVDISSMRAATRCYVKLTTVQLLDCRPLVTVRKPLGLAFLTRLPRGMLLLGVPIPLSAPPRPLLFCLRGGFALGS